MHFGSGKRGEAVIEHNEKAKVNMFSGNLPGLGGPLAPGGAGGPGGAGAGPLQSFGGLGGIFTSMGNMFRLIQQIGSMLNMLRSFGPLLGGLGGQAATGSVQPQHKQRQRRRTGPGSKKSAPKRSGKR